jgi:Putative Actinobacterial Holin-X, holin superfamily III
MPLLDEGQDVMNRIAGVVLAISEAVAAWVAPLIVGAALLAVAGSAALMGKNRLQRATPPVPEETVAASRLTWK